MIRLFWVGGAFGVAAFEIVVVMLISTSPVTVGALMKLSRSVELNKTLENYIDLALKLIFNGELFLYSTSILGIVIFMTYKVFYGDRYGKIKGFLRATKIFTVIVINFFVLLVLIISISLYSYVVLDIDVDKEFVFDISKWTFFGSLIIYYLILVIINAKMPDLQGTLRKDSDDFSNALRKHRS